MSLDTFTRAKARQAYQPANTRMCCRNCTHVSGQSPSAGFQCLKGGFFVTAYAVCANYQAKPEVAAK